MTLAGLSIQVDGLWPYLKNKNNQLRVFVGFEVESRFWVNFEVGSRTTHTANKLLKRLKRYIGNLPRAVPLKVSTDSLVAYKNAQQPVFTGIGYMPTCKS